MINSTVIKLPAQEWERIIQLGIENHIRELELELARANERVADLEAQYKTTLKQLDEAGLPENAGLREHEDFVEWSSWESYRNELQAKLTNLRALVATSDVG
jgi:hypothetical protein